MRTLTKQNIAIIGTGYWGKNLVRNFYELGALHTLCDSNETTLNSFQHQYPTIQATTEFDRVLADKEIQGVVIATPAETHASLAMKAIDAGKDILVEKPLALTPEEGETICQKVKSNKRVGMVGHVLLYHPAILKLKALIENGELGKLQYIYSTRLNFGKVRSEENILWSFAPHDISILLYLLNEMPDRVTAIGSSYLNPNIVDNTISTFRFPSGVNSHIFVSWLHPYKEQNLVVVGEKQMASFTDSRPEKKLMLYPHHVEWKGNIPTLHKAEGNVIEFENKEPLREECLEFLRCIDTRESPRTNVETGLSVLRILHNCEQSMKNDGKGIFLRSRMEENPPYFVHSTSCVDEPCAIGAGTKIWHYSHIMKNSVLGENCNLGQNVFVQSDVKIGNNCKIQNNVSVYTGVELEDDVFCGPSMVFTNIRTPRSSVNRRSQYVKTLVKQGATLGANCTIVCGATIGRNAVIGAGAVVTKDVPDHAVMLGVPAVQKGWACACGVPLHRDSSGLYHCLDCGNRYQENKENQSIQQMEA